MTFLILDGCLKVSAALQLQILGFCQLRSWYDRTVLYEAFQLKLLKGLGLNLTSELPVSQPNLRLTRTNVLNIWGTPYQFPRIQTPPYPHPLN